MDQDTLSVYFIRHGESEANITKIIAGQTPSPLTPTGIQQAKELRKILPKYDFIYVSSMKRAIDTAKYVVPKDRFLEGKDYVILDELAERNWGKLEGVEYTNILRQRREIDPSLYRAHLDENQVETDESLRTRMQKVLDYIISEAKASDHKSILIFTHGGVIKQFFEWNHFVLEGTIYNTEIISTQFNSDGWTLIERIQPK